MFKSIGKFYLGENIKLKRAISLILRLSSILLTKKSAKSNLADCKLCLTSIIFSYIQNTDR